jgi:hypothetical protein
MGSSESFPPNSQVAARSPLILGGINKFGKKISGLFLPLFYAH